MTYPNLVPVRGGSDSGRDADLIQPSGNDPVRMAITSSRTEAGARANLRNSLKSLEAHDLAGIAVISVSLAELNEAKRRKLQELASDYGYHLQAVIDRGFFTDRLLTSGEWRQKLLGLRGGPFSLSRTPSSILFGTGTPTFVGRDAAVEVLQAETRDVVVWGLPGVGKSALLSHLGGLYFVEGDPPIERLMDDILETQPSHLVVDDAMRRLGVVEMLASIRRQEQLGFALMAVCWPHEREIVRASLPDSVEFEVEPLIRPEIAQIVRGHGVDGTIEIAQILDQAQGRPAWAVYLADFAQADSGAGHLYGGTALYSRVVAYEARSGLRTAARDVLAFIALMGSLSDSEIPRLGQQLGVSRADLTHSINDIAIGGLLEVDRTRVGGSYQNIYCVAADVLATRIVIEYFFSGSSPTLPVREVFDQFPSKRLGIALAVIRCVLAGTHDAKADAHHLFEMVADDAEIVGSRETLMHHYLHLGPTEALLIVDRGVSAWSDIDAGAPHLKSVAQAALISYLGEAIVDMHVLKAVDRAVAVSMQLHRGEMTPFWSKLVDKIRGFGPAGTIEISLLIKVWRKIRSSGGDNFSDEHRAVVAVAAVRQILRPTFDASWMSAEDLNVVHLISATMPPAATSALTAEVWDNFEQHSPVLTRDDLQILVDLAKEWSRMARGFGPHSNCTISDDQAALASILALKIAQFIINASTDFPGIRAQVRALAQPLGTDYPEQDALLAMLFEPRRNGSTWTQWQEYITQRVRDQITPYLNEAPEVLCCRLSELKSEIDGTELGMNRLYMVFAAVADSGDNLLAWLHAARKYNLLDESHRVLARLLDGSKIENALFIDLLGESAVRGTLINAALSQRLAGRYFDVVESRISPQDLGQLGYVLHRENYSASAIARLLTSERVDVRSATAAALLAANEDDDEFLTSDLNDLWRTAIAQLEIPMRFDLRGDHDFYDKLLARAPQVYEDLFLDVIRTAPDVYAALNAFGQSGYKLSAEAKSRILTASTSDVVRWRVFWALNGGDADWIGQPLDMNIVDVDFVMDAVNGIGQAVPIDDLARILVPRGVDPTEIAAKIELGTQWGERHQRLANYLEEMTTYSQSPDPGIATVGRAGVALFEPRYQVAVNEHKRNMIRGRS
ncbi:hypothetical protein GS571_05785 [Rhodococcus hoagii]|nr:hypothetical protein [Prescottella equi]